MSIKYWESQSHAFPRKFFRFQESYIQRESQSLTAISCMMHRYTTCDGPGERIPDRLIAVFYNQVIGFLDFHAKVLGQSIELHIRKLLTTVRRTELTIQSLLARGG